MSDPSPSGDEDWSWACGQEALSEWAAGFVASIGAAS